MGPNSGGGKGNKEVTSTRSRFSNWKPPTAKSKAGGKGGKGGKKGKGEGKGAASNAPPPPPKAAGGKGVPKIDGQPLAWWEDCFRCAACHVDSSGRIAFAQHCVGSKHREIHGDIGFAGVEPNKAGIIPVLTPELRILIEKAVAGNAVISNNTATKKDSGKKKDGGGKKSGGKAQDDDMDSELQSVGALSQASDRVVRDALNRNESDTALFDEVLSSVQECDLGGNNAEANNPKANKRRNGAPAPSLQPPPKLASGDGMGPMAAQRRGLPVFAWREELLKTIGANRVTVVEGETGSGKTTQVPQFVMEDAAARGIACNVVVAQPRRISAMSVAERVASERGERIGGTVGYTIRLESKTSAATRLLFCTTGILLKRLEDDGMLTNVTHVFVDEVHERSIESDFLLMVLRDLLAKRPELRAVLMSATLDADLFHRYFDGAPSVKFPGRTFPVAELYLEHALELTGHEVKRGAEWARTAGGGKGGGGGGGKGGGKGSGGGKDDGVCNDFKLGRCTRGASCKFSHGPSPGTGGGGGGGKGGGQQPDDDEALTLAELAVRYSSQSHGTHQALLALDHNAIDYELVAQVLGWMATLGSDASGQVGAWLRSGGKGRFNASRQTASSGAEDEPRASSKGSSSNNASSKNDAVLVFLPGIKEITAVQEALLAMPAFKQDPQRSWVLPLHSTVPPEEQRRAFMRPPPGVRKIVLATNIAETAITVDDVGFVVDTGRMKENRYDPARRLSSLEDCLVSRANARQRRGRAGRVQPGVAVHLFTSHRHKHVCLSAQAPEVQRVPLEQLVLRIKALQYPGTAAQVCARLIEPPKPEAVTHAVDELVSIEALTVKTADANGAAVAGNKKGSAVVLSERLTALGVHLSTLPVDCRVGKLILMGCMFGCGDEALTIAATLSYRSPFMSPPQKREEADAAKHRFATHQSDHLTALKAYNECDVQGGKRFEFARENFLGIKTLQTIAGLKRQLLELLSDAGFVRRGLRARAVEALGRRIDGTDGVRLALDGGLENGAGSGGGGGGGGRGGGGDWECPQCVASVFASKSKCFKCGEARPETAVPADCESHVGGGVEGGVESGNGVEGGSRVDDKAPMLKALLVAALFPQVVTVDEPAPAKGKGGGKGGGGLKFRAREENDSGGGNGKAGSATSVEVALHPSCVASKVTKFPALASKYWIYHERVQTTRVFVRDATPVHAYALLLFGGRALTAEAGNTKGGKAGSGSSELVVRLDGWLGFKVPARDRATVLALRQQLDAALRRKVEQPHLDFTDGARGLINAVKTILDDKGK